MKIVEENLVSKKGLPEENEDRIAVTDSFCAVIDGMTPKDRSIYNGKSSGLIAASLIKEAVGSLSADILAHEAAEIFTQCLSSYYTENGLLPEVTEHPHKRMGANMIMYSRVRREIWMIGDCHGLVDAKPIRNEKLIDLLLAALRSQLVERYLQKKTVEELCEHDLSREDLAPFLQQQYLYQNSREHSLLSYTVIDGFPLNPADIKIIAVPEAKEIVLASDGYPILKNTLEATECELQHLLEKDPLCYKENRSTKGLQKGSRSFDDRAYLKISLHS